jgi:hypothetical protein
MDKIYFVEDIQSDRMNYADELSEFDHDVVDVSSSLLFELMDKNTARSVDKRAHKRFQVNKDAFALIRPAAAEQLRVADRNMAEIACAVYQSKPVRFGRINNISMGGLSFRYIAGEGRSNQSLVLDILLVDYGFYLCNLTFKSIADVEIIDDFAINPFEIRQHHVQFDRLVPAQITKLRGFIHNYSITGIQG